MCCCPQGWADTRHRFLTLEPQAASMSPPCREERPTGLRASLPVRNVSHTWSRGLGDPFQLLCPWNGRPKTVLEPPGFLKYPICVLMLRPVSQTPGAHGTPTFSHCPSRKKLKDGSGLWPCRAQGPSLGWEGRVQCCRAGWPRSLDPGWHVWICVIPSRQAHLTSGERGPGGWGRKVLVYVKRPSADLRVLRLSC